tara:strand:- start:18767 stop:19591 length:825 start_codon:yes stop_codon:yes gene_type:complete
MHDPAKFIEKQNQAKLQRLKAEKASYKRSKWGRIRNHAYMMIFLPLLIPVHLCLLIIFAIFKERSFHLIYSYLKSYFNLYFFFCGIQKLLIFPPSINKPTKPTLFFTTRNYDFIANFLPTLFSYPIAVPFAANLRLFPIHFFFPFLRIGSFATVLGYDDKPLTESLPDIHRSLKQGIPTVVFIHPHVITPMFNETLPMYNEILELMDTSIDCYFLACKGIEATKAGTIFFPTFVSIHCLSSDELFEGIEKTHVPETEKLLRIMKFFDYQKMEII